MATIPCQGKHETCSSPMLLGVSGQRWRRKPQSRNMREQLPVENYVMVLLCGTRSVINYCQLLCYCHMLLCCCYNSMIKKTKHSYVMVTIPISMSKPGGRPSQVVFASLCFEPRGWHSPQNGMRVNCLIFWLVITCHGYIWGLLVVAMLRCYPNFHIPCILLR